MLIAVDTGGTKTLVALVSSDGVIEQTSKFPTPHDIDEYIAVLTNTIGHLTGNQQPDTIVVALPGVVKNNIGLWCGNLEWEDVDMRRSLRNEFHHATIYVENDANLAGLGEAHALNPIPESLLYATISTGIGTGIIENGLIDTALRYSEAGHMQLEFENELQAWEHFASGKAIKRDFDKLAGEITSDETWQQITYRFGLGFLVLIPVIQPTVIVIGGSVGTHFARYQAKLQALLEEKLPPHIPCPELRQAAHPEEAVIYGCYRYAVQQSIT